MGGTDIVAILFISCGMLVGIVGIVAWMIVSLATGRRATPRVGNSDESQMIQEIFHGLSKMEQRVESLETLLLERDKRG